MSVDLQSITLTSGVNDEGEGFVTIAATSTDGIILIGQLDPDLVRGMALDWLEAAEAADQDAAVLRCIRKLELDERLAGMIVTELRNAREGEGDDDE